MKKYMVTSTRKNPDKYIELLKDQVRRAMDANKVNFDDWRKSQADLFKEQGKHFFDYTKGVTQTAIMTNTDYTQVNIGSTVKFISKVIKMERGEQGKVIITFELEEARI
jgi:hypothetical protein